MGREFAANYGSECVDSLKRAMQLENWQQVQVSVQD